MQEARARVLSLRAPKCLVLATETAEAASARRGCAVAELFQRTEEALFADGALRSVPFRTPSKSFSLRNFRIVFAGTAYLEPQNIVSGQEEALKAVLQAHPPSGDLKDWLRDGPEDESDVERFVADRFEQPWCAAFRTKVAEGFLFQETEMFGSPLACVMVASTKDPDMMKSFEELNSPYFLPSGFQQGQYDPNMHKYYVLLHDAADPETAHIDVDSLAEALKQSLPPGSFLNIKLENADNLDENDMERLKSFLFELIRSKILAATENRLIALESRISAQRKGLRNTFRTFWRKSKESGGGTTNFESRSGTQTRRVLYLHDSIESQLRLLADLAFMLQDYDLALSTYKMARDDFASDREYLHHGEALQMIAYSYFMKGNHEKDVFDYFRRAQSSFKDAIISAKANHDPKARAAQVSLAARYLTNCTLNFAEAVVALSIQNPQRYLEATECLARASVEETTLCSAVLLEQTGMFLLFQDLSSEGRWAPGSSSRGVASEAKSPRRSNRLRKFGFHMAMAGVLYRNGDQLLHALHCFACVKNLYQGTRWNHIIENVHLTLADYASKLSFIDQAVLLRTEALSIGSMAEEKQLEALEEVRKMLESSQLFHDASQVWNIPIPDLRDGLTAVKLHENASVIPDIDHDVTQPFHLVEMEGEPLMVTVSAKRKRDEESWLELQQYLQDVSPDANSLEGSIVQQRRRKTGRRDTTSKVQVCYVGESFFVDVALHNPSKAKLYLTDIRLLVEERDESDQPLGKSSEHGPSEVLNSCVLDACTTSILRIKVTPRHIGSLQIVGIEWKFLGIPRVVRYFDICGLPLNETQEQRCSDARDEDIRLKKIVKDQAPWLGAELSGVPSPVLSGETVPITLDLINLGKKPCVGPVLMCCNLPVICVGASTTEVEDVVADSLSVPIDDGACCFALPVENLSAEGTLVSVPLVLRAPPGSPGKRTIRILLRYGDALATRHLRLEQTIETKKALSASLRCLRHPFSAMQPLILCKLKNLSPRELNVTRVFNISGKWSMKKMSSTSWSGRLYPKEEENVLFCAETNGGGNFECLDISKISSTIIPISTATRKHFLGAAHAHHVLHGRRKAEDKYLKLKTRLEKSGKLPMSIQDVRRRNREEGNRHDPDLIELEELKKETLSRPGEPSPWSNAALWFEERGLKLHAIFEWEHAEGSGQENIVGLGVLQESPLELQLFHSRTSSQKSMQVKVVVLNASTEIVKDALLVVKRTEMISWKGLTRLALPDLARGESHEFILTAFFHGTGMLNLNGFFFVFPGFEDSEIPCDGNFLVSVSSLKDDVLKSPLSKRNSTFDIEEDIRKQLDEEVFCDQDLVAEEQEQEEELEDEEEDDDAFIKELEKKLER